MHGANSWSGICIASFRMRIAFDSIMENRAADAKAKALAPSDSTPSGSKEHQQTSATPCPTPIRERVLKVACGLFAEAGFHGTHLREVCKRANANVAGVCYHFRDKEGLYDAVIEEAVRQLASPAKADNSHGDSPPECRLRALIQSLSEKLSGERVWIAKLLARELMDSVSGTSRSARSGLRNDFVLLQFLLRELLQPETDGEAICFHALSIVCDCVFFSIAASCHGGLGPELACRLPSETTVAQLVANRSIDALNHERVQRRHFNP